MRQPGAPSNRQICDDLRSCTTHHGRLLRTSQATRLTLASGHVRMQTQSVDLHQKEVTGGQTVQVRVSQIDDVMGIGYDYDVMADLEAVIRDEIENRRRR